LAVSIGAGIRSSQLGYSPKPTANTQAAAVGSLPPSAPPAAPLLPQTSTAKNGAMVSQIRVQKQARPRRRARGEAPDAEQRHVDECTGLARRAPAQQASAKIYRWLALPSWNE
jgi:hypothetical protein